jgi:hypothetical protein
MARIVSRTNALSPRCGSVYFVVVTKLLVKDNDMSTSLAKEKLIKENSEFIAWAGTEFGPESTNRNSQGDYLNPDIKMAWNGWLAKAEHAPSRVTLERIERFVLWFTFAYVFTQMTYNLTSMYGAL